MGQPESIEDYYARIAAATVDGRLPVAVEEMPGWDIFPYEIDSLRIKPLQPLAAAEPPRRGEDAAQCWCVTGEVDDSEADVVWWNDNWLLRAEVAGSGLPIMVWLSPRRHCDLGSIPADLASELGGLITTISAAIEALPSVGRAQLAKYGDGGAHLHLLLMGRPARMLQFRGSPLLDWEENLPRVPAEVVWANAAPIGRALSSTYGGQLGSRIN